MVAAEHRNKVQANVFFIIAISPRLITNAKSGKPFAG
jgi:hypothetical protein